MQARVQAGAPGSPSGSVSAAETGSAAYALTGKLTNPFLLALFFVVACLPMPFSILDVQLSPYRAYMLAVMIPLLVSWISGKAGPIVRADYYFVAFSVWNLVVMVVNHGPGKFPFAVLTTMEIFGAYLIGRVLIRNVNDYKFLFRCLIITMICLFPFVFGEMDDGSPVLLDFIRSFYSNTFGDIQHPPRMGFYRVQSVFPHPILFGVFCSLAIANIFYIWKTQLAIAFSGMSFALFMTFTSLSSGPFLAGVGQVAFILWGKLTRDNWKMLMWIAIAIFVFLSIASNRGPIVLMIETLAFSSETGWVRIKQWEFGSREVLRHPIFGLGLGDWVRPGWLGPSVDNYWLAMAMRYGFPGIFFLVGGLVLNFRSIVKVRNLPTEVANIRTGYLITSVSIYLALATVYVWGSTGILIFIYFGAGVWIYTTDWSQSEVDPSETDAKRASLPFARRAPDTATARQSRAFRRSL